MTDPHRAAIAAKIVQDGLLTDVDPGDQPIVAASIAARLEINDGHLVQPIANTIAAFRASESWWFRPAAKDPPATVKPIKVKPLRPLGSFNLTKDIMSRKGLE